MWLRGRLPVLAGTAVGIGAAALLTLLQSSTYRADASIALVRQGQPPGDDPALAQAAEAAAELFHSRAVAEPAVANLRLDESAEELLDRVTIETEADSSLVRVSVEAPSPEEARRAAQEVTELSTVLFNDRFGPQTVASVWEPPRAKEDRVAPKPARNLALGALLGALLGWAVGSAARSRARIPERPKRAKQPKQPKPQKRPAQQAPAGPPAAEPVPAPVPDPVTEVLPEPVPEPEPQPEGPFVLPRLGEWTVRDVERLLAEQGDAFPDRREELEVYLDSFRGVAGPDGRLPGGVEAVMEDVFRDLIARAKIS